LPDDGWFLPAVPPEAEADEELPAPTPGRCFLLKCSQRSASSSSRSVSDTCQRRELVRGTPSTRCSTNSRCTHTDGQLLSFSSCLLPLPSLFSEPAPLLPLFDLFGLLCSVDAGCKDSDA